ncbi:hypothetical protein HMN09_00076100 [Mycena chlorophos]|uniref:Uncharacterized protein n=1 Tax=Mycena chlorophos TaxID=658473 RepID=A0A8H6TSK7_MYCCL|nr:hypothetical protein HMN09_00076100 [Mycena chlorophos]
MLKTTPSKTLPKRLSVFIHDSPSKIVLEESSPLVLNDSPTTYSPQAALKTPRPRSLHVQRSPRARPKSYGGGLTVEALELVLDFESRIAEMESRHRQVVAELEEARDALNNERANRRSSNRFSTLSHARFSSVSSSATAASDSPVGKDGVDDVEYERRLRTELQDTLKKIRAQNDTITRSLRQQEESCASLSASLEEERRSRKAAEEEVGRLSAVNVTLFEHNKLLAGRDAALQEDISALTSRAEAEGTLRAALEAELDRIAASPPTPLPLDVDESVADSLSSAREELQIATERLSTAEEECIALRQRVAALQQQLVMCVDSSSQALEFERELRADMEERSRLLADENSALKTRLDSLEEVFPSGHAPDAWIKRSPPKRRPISIRVDKRLSTVSIPKTPKLERYRDVATSRRMREHKRRRLAAAGTEAAPRRAAIAAPALSTTPAVSTFVIPAAFPIRPVVVRASSLPTTPAPDSACSDATKVASPVSSISSSRRKSKRAAVTHMSAIVAATLSKHTPEWSRFKTDSSIFVDINSSIDEPMQRVHQQQHASPVKPKRDLRTFLLRTSTTLFIDPPELTDDNLV